MLEFHRWTFLFVFYKTDNPIASKCAGYSDWKGVSKMNTPEI